MQKEKLKNKNGKQKQNKYTAKQLFSQSNNNNKQKELKIQKMCFFS